MYKISIISLLLLVGIASLFAQTIQSLKAVSNGDAIVVEWESVSEDGLDGFELQRAPEGVMFKSIKAIDAKGYAGKYRIVDEEAFMKDGDQELQQQTQFKYRLKIIGKDGSVTYSESVNVSHKISSIRRTWGMIKEMFK